MGKKYVVRSGSGDPSAYSSDIVLSNPDGTPWGDNFTTATAVIKAGAPAVVPLDLPTFDGNPDVGHPSVVDAGEAKWNGYRYWMAFTPYPGANREDPSVLASNDAVTWVVPAGLVNPLYTNAQALAEGAIANSDTELLLVDGVLRCYWRTYGTTMERIYVRTSTNGTSWTNPVLVLEATGTSVAGGRTDILSPAIVREANGTYSMWTVKGASSATVRELERRTSTNGLGSWSAPASVTFPAGIIPWHIEVKRLGSTYHALAATTQPSRLFYLTSADGLAFTGDVTRPAVELSGLSKDTDKHYRSALLATPDSPARWDIYVNGIDIVDGTSNEDWRILLHRNATLPTKGRTELNAAETRDKLAAMFRIAPFLGGDSFARVDSAANLGTSTSGHAWTALTGTLGISSGRAYAVTTGRSVIETGVADVELGVDLVGTLDATAYMLLRAVDDNNWHQIGYSPTDKAVYVFKRVAGTVTQVKASATALVRAGDRIRAKAVGTRLDVWVNDVLVVENFAIPDNPTATKHGIQIATGAIRLKDFTVRTAA